MIALFHGVSLTSRLIRWFNWGVYSHAAWCREDGGSYEAWRGISRGDRQAKVRFGTLGANHTPGTRIDLFDVSGLTTINKIVIERFLHSQLGKPYDWMGIVHFVTRRPEYPSGQEKWFCSELVAAACAHGGVPLFRELPAYKISPSMLACSPLLQYRRTCFAGMPSPLPTVKPQEALS